MMHLGRSIYRIYDPDSQKHGCKLITNNAANLKWVKESDDWSRQHWGIFWTINKMKESSERSVENCVQVLSWALDLDKGSKEEQLKTIKNLTIQPSAVIETKSGHHVYFDSIDGDPNEYRNIVDRMVEVYGGDPKAKDAARILRVPGWCHWKNPKEPFAIKLLNQFSSNAKYTQKEMLRFFPPIPEDLVESKATLKKDLKFQSDNDLFEKIWSLDCEHALTKLSGTEAVGGEIISFKKTTGGKLNILINNKGTSCWIDTKKRIGSSDKGGPTIWQWVNWYHKDHKKTYQLLKQYLPEVFK